MLQNRSSEVRFLIDTGADATVLHPRDAYRLLGDELHRIDFERDSRRIAGLGVGGALGPVYTSACPRPSSVIPALAAGISPISAAKPRAASAIPALRLLRGFLPAQE